MKDAVIILGDLRTYKVEIDGKKTAMKGCFVVGAYDGKNFSGTEYDSKNNELGQVSYNKEKFSENIQRFYIVRGEQN